METIDDRLNNLGTLNFKVFFRILGKMQIKVFISLLSSFLICSFFVFKLGQQYQVSGEALSLHRLFSMNLELGKDATGNKKINFRDLYLLESKVPSPIPGKAFLEIRRYNEEGGTEKVGSIHAVKPDIKPVPRVSLPELTKTAYAAGKFNWHGRMHNRNFSEKYTSKKTIRRYYDDGWVLEYKVDNNGNSIGSSFRWIKKGR